ncbi:MAG TPA: IS200/IS605 family transposase [Longimicrobiaceae bacterium]
MREPFTQLYIHLVWATWDRLPLLSSELLEVVDRAVRHECVELNVEVEAFGGVADHVHLLVRIPARVSVADLVKQVKGATSHLINQRLKVPFKWQGGYGAFSVSKAVLPRVRDYVLNQQQHHEYGTAVASAELPVLEA